MRSQDERTLVSPECQVSAVSLECGVLLLLQLYHDIAGLLPGLLISLVNTQLIIAIPQSLVRSYLSVKHFSKITWCPFVDLNLYNFLVFSCLLAFA